MPFRLPHLIPLALALACIAPTTAHAVPPSASVALPIAVGTHQDSLGLSSLQVSYSWDKAYATTGASAVTLPQGSFYRVITCLQMHVYGGAFGTTCAEKRVDARDSALPVVTNAPTVKENAHRPKSGAWGYAYHQVIVQRRKPDGSFGYHAGTSTAGLTKAGVGLPPLSSWTPSELVQQGVEYPDSFVGGINSGTPDSMCMGSPKTASTPGDVSTTALGSDAPAYYEVGDPSGEYEAQSPKGVMLVVHSGAWNAHGPGSVARMRADADRWRARGWRTLNLTHRPCEKAFADVRWFYDRAREFWGSDLPYCALGASAGGNLALLVAAQRPSLSCVVNKAGPTYAKGLREQTASDGSPTGQWTTGPRYVFNMLTAAVGEENTYWYSPALFPIKARVLSAFEERDFLIPMEQASYLRERMLERDADAYSDVVRLASGDRRFVHTDVSQESIEEFHAREEALVAPLVAD